VANYTNKLSYVHRAQRNAEGEPDIMRKWKLIKVLREKFNIVARTGPKLGIEKKFGYIHFDLARDELRDHYLHNPDVTALNHNPPLIFEIDGDVHFLKDKAIKATNDRNEHYEMAVHRGHKAKLIWVSDKEADLTDEMLALVLYQKFKDQGIKVELKA